MTALAIGFLEQSAQTAEGLGERLGGAGATRNEWQLVWSDEFNQRGRPNPRNWAYETGLVRNHELQWFDPKNAWCENGMLILEARRKRRRNPDFQRDSNDWRTSREFTDYSAASLMTKGLHSWRYGRFEMRGRIPTGAGLWPVFWTQGVAGEWPSNGEIDIMEYYRGTLRANAAWGSGVRWFPLWDIFWTPIAAFRAPDWARRFHVWRMEWDHARIKLYVDESLVNTIDLETTVNRDKTGKNPFRQPHYLLLTLAVGGTRGGNPAKGKFPARFEVDYVRVYQLR